MYMEIIKNKPMPFYGMRHGAMYIIADQMEVGDCILCKDRKAAHGIYVRLLRANKKGISRQLPEGIGVWRTE